MAFLRPTLLLLLVPVLAAWWTTRPGGRLVAALRLVAAVLLVAALALPYAPLSDPGRDLVVVVDRSRSMPADAEERALELVRLAQAEAGPGDRVGVVAFGAEPGLERLPSPGAEPFRGFTRALDLDATDLAGALETALSLVPAGRSGALVVLSDGEVTGADPGDAARRAFARGVPVHVRPELRPATADLSIERVELPGDVAVGEPFQFSAWVRADRRVEAEFTLRRGSTELSSGRRVFEPGLNRVLFRDVLLEPGIAAYDVTLTHAGDARPENDAALGAVRVRGERRLLVLNDDGGESPLVRALRGAALPVDVAAPEDVRLEPLALSRWRAVVLEDVGAQRLGEDALRALREHVLERGAGLLMTGGRASFGVGGYHLTPVDELLPVSLEQRQEHRKQGVAMAFVLDTSGSMQAPAGGGLTKMDLANAGTVEALRLLSPLDAAVVLSVDSAPEVVVPLTQVTDAQRLASRVRGIQAGGGGIFVMTGLQAALRELEGAPQVNRHVVLFADAADAEEQEGVVALARELGAAGTTLSVIALGTVADRDAAFLKNVAAAGGGEIYITTAPEELPRLFAQDTLTVARSTFVQEPTDVAVLPDVVSLGRLDLSGWPTLDGYNLTYLRPGAFAAAATTDEYRAPLLSFWYQGVGRVAAYTGQVGGSFGRRLVAWERFAEVFVTLGRWLAGQEEPEDLFADVRREGRELVVSVEVDPDAPTPPDTSRLTTRVQAADGTWREHVLERVGTHRYEARAPLRADAVTLGTVRLVDAAGEERVLELPPVALPYSPEFERSPEPDRGARVLRRLAEATGGVVDPSAAQLFAGPRATRVGRVFARELLLAGLVLLLLEVAVRRLGLSFASSALRARRLLTRLALSVRARLARRVRPPASGPRVPSGGDVPPPGRPDGAAPPPPADEPPASAPSAGSPSSPRPAGDLADALARARSRASKQTRR